MSQQQNNTAEPVNNNNNTPGAPVAQNNNNQVSMSDLTSIMQSQGFPATVQSQILGAVLGSTATPAVGSTVDMASVLAKIQALEKEKMDLRSKLESTNNTLHKYREEKSVGMKDRYAKEMKDFIDGLQLKDPEIKNSMHAKMEELAKQGNETGVWEILACASSNHRASVNQIETLTQELNSYKDKERQLQGGLFQSEMSRFQQDTNQIGSAGVKRARAEDSIAGGGAMDNSIMGESNDIWSDFHSMVMRSGGNRGADYSAAVPFGAQPTVPM